ncbi:hypothetical protein JOD57_003850 [Geodermatophilus bullaregiensis]|uniref:hypothetical protein n=1 Tax=Geodermatophilus bullaregiensis TaxID=1564160 RepID=UPI00195B7990|nr:hypothetical protein [Geodermatophilus bullaregiensis]MBM7808013.1 hypothetical protein [Geodermatophilus bullaregiensis]
MQTEDETPKVFGVEPDVFSAYVGLIAAFLALLGIGGVLRQLRQADRTALFSVVLQIDALLAGHTEQRRWINANHGLSPEDQADAPDIVPYMAIFERLSAALASGLVSRDWVYRFYSSRLRRLLRMAHVRKLLVNQAHGWQYLIRLAVELDAWAKYNELRPVIVTHAPPRNEGDAEPDTAFLAVLRSKVDTRQVEVRDV